MATVIGEPQAWKSIREKLSGEALTVDGPEALRRLASTFQFEQSAWQNLAENQITATINELTEKISNFNAKITKCQQEADAIIGPQIQALELSLQEFQSSGHW